MDIDLPSGAKLTVTKAPFPEAMALNKALLRCAKGLPLARDLWSMDMAVLKDALVEAATSDEVEAHLFKCLARTAYNGVRVTKDIFDDPQLGDAARKDYYAMSWKVIEVNCSPFFEQAFSWFKAPRPTAPAAPR